MSHDEFIEKKEAKGLISSRIWRKQHQACPDCDNIKLMVTLVGIIEYDNTDYIDDRNTATCKCGWRGPVRTYYHP